jgi:uncharacterized oxidoreductase
MPQVHADELRGLARDILIGIGSEPDSAQEVADSLVAANLAGHDSHGVLRLVGYCGSVRSGDVQAAAQPVELSRRGATAQIDGAWGWGQPAMRMATDAAIDLAREYGLGAAIVRRCYHVGRVAPYVERVARAGMVGIAMLNAGPAVAPYQGRKRVLGTNPVAWAVPRGEGKEPLSFDVATAGVAEGKLRVARAKGEQVRPGLLVDAEGKPTQNPDDFYAGGALLPFGDHKGYGFSVMAQVIGRALVGMDTTSFTGPRGANGPLIIALDVSPFVPLETFEAEVEAQCDLIASCPPGEGYDCVLLPGDPEIANRQQREAEGIPVPERTWSELLALAEELGVSVATT